MRLPLTALAAVLVPLINLVQARSSTGDRVLVVLESLSEKDGYSKFWRSLESRGFSLTFKGPKDDTAELSKYGEQQYDHLIMYAPSTKAFSKSLSPQAVLHAQLAGLNTLYLLSPTLSDINRDTFREYDVEFTDYPAAEGNTLISPFSSLPSGPSSALVYPTSSAISTHNPVLSTSTLSSGPIVLPRAITHSLGQTPYLFPILSAPRGSYVGSEGVEAEGDAQIASRKPASGEVVLAGKSAGIVSASQTRDNVRIGFVGSGEAFRDEYWAMEVVDTDGVKHQTSNQAFAEDLTKWVFQETGVIKVAASTHSGKGGELEKAQYTKNEQVTYSISISEYDPTTTSYRPFTPASAEDLQLEFTMLDPFVRTPLKLDTSGNSTAARSDASTFTASFRAPDRHGVFKFVVEYWRPGWSYLRSSTTTAVVPLRHDEHERFITGAFPFYGAAASTSVAFLLFCGVWLSLGEERGRKKVE